MVPAKPCKTSKNSQHVVTRGKSNEIKSNQNLRVLWKPVNPQDCVWENLYRIIMRTNFQERETIHCSITIWYTNSFLCFQAMKIPAAKAAVDKEWENWRKFRRGTWRKLRKHGRRAQKFIFPHRWTSVIERMLNWRQSTKNIKVELYSEVILWKMTLNLMQYSLNISITNDSSKSHGYHLQIAGLRWTSSRRSIGVYPSKNGRCSKMIEKLQNRNVQTFGFVYHDTNGLNHGPVWKTQSFLLSEICTVIL